MNMEVQSRFKKKHLKKTYCKLTHKFSLMYDFIKKCTIIYLYLFTLHVTAAVSQNLCSDALCWIALAHAQ